MARLWDAASGREQAVLRERWIFSAAFSPDGQRVVTIASISGTVRLWDAASGREWAVLRGHRNDVTSAAFSPDGRRVVTASWDGTARLWDAASGREWAVLRHMDRVISAAFSPDGQRVVTTAGDGTARLWRVFATTQALIEYARSIVPRALTPDQRRQFFLEESAPEDGPAMVPHALPAPGSPVAARPPE